MSSLPECIANDIISRAGVACDVIRPGPSYPYDRASGLDDESCRAVGDGWSIEIWLRRGEVFVWSDIVLTSNDIPINTTCFVFDLCDPSCFDDAALILSGGKNEHVQSHGRV